MPDVYTPLLPHVRAVHLARTLQRPAHVHPAHAGTQPAAVAVAVAFDGDITRAPDFFVRVDRTRLQAGNGHDRFDHRPRWVLTLDGAVVERVLRVVEQLFVVLVADAADEQVRVEA